MPQLQFPLEGSSSEALGNVNDPLLQKGNRKVLHGAEQMPEEDLVHMGELTRRTLILAAGPTVLFTIMITVTTFGYNDAPYRVIASFALTLVKAGCVAWVFNGRRWISWLGPLLAVASCVGLVAGLRIYSSDLALYYRYRDSARHVNVAAAEDATRFVGTGMVGFKAGTRVDVDRSVGYLSARAGTKLCVAPVVDGSMGPVARLPFLSSRASGKPCDLLRCRHGLLQLAWALHMWGRWRC